MPDDALLGIVTRVLVRLQEGICDRVAEGASEDMRCARDSAVTNCYLEILIVYY